MKKDFLGIAASSLCAVHCLATPFVIALIPTSAGDTWKSPMAHYIFAAIVTFFCVTAAISGYSKHKDFRIIALMSLALVLIITATFLPCGDGCCESPYELPLLVGGSLAMIAGHFFNYRACCSQCETTAPEAID